MKNYTDNLKNNGVVILPKLFSSLEINKAKKKLWGVIQGNYNTGIEPENRFWNIGDNPKSIIKIDKPHLCSNTLFKLITKGSFGRYLADLTNSKTVQIWHSQAVWKPAGGGEKGNAGWHRDAQYWPFWNSKGLYTAWIALSDVKLNSGPVKFIKQSNKWKFLDDLDFFDKKILDQEKIIKKFHKNIKIIKSTISKGQVSVHDALTYHCSGPNKSRYPRVGLVVHFRTEKSKIKKTYKKYLIYLKQLKDYTRCPTIYDA